jgi:hypothetical protein
VIAIKVLISEGWSTSAAAREVLARSGDSGDALRTPAVYGAERADAGADPETMSALYRLAVGLLDVTSPHDARALLESLVRSLGGALAAPDSADSDALLPVDISLGIGPPVVVRATPLSLARMRLEAVLPAMVERAHRQVALIRLVE